MYSLHALMYVLIVIFALFAHVALQTAQLSSGVVDRSGHSHAPG